MKKLELKKPSFKKKDAAKKPEIVTQKNLEQSREEVLARGKKFKYPFQYSKHKMVINATLIGIAAVIVLSFVGWHQLYKAQNTGNIAYRFTKVLGLPVAEIDGAKVRYSDYLMFYRSSIKSIERQQGELANTEDNNMLRLHYKRRALTTAEDYTYALAKLNENGIIVDSSEVDDLVSYHIQINGQARSEKAFEGIVKDNFGLSMTEYRRMLTLSLAKKKFSENFDTKASDLVKKAEKMLESNKNLSEVAEALGEPAIVSYEKTTSMVSDTNIDGGRALEAKSLEHRGDVSKAFVSKNGDCYYIVKLTERENGKVMYESIAIRFTELSKQVAEVRKNGGVTEKIKLDVGSEEGIEAEENTDESSKKE